MNLSLNKTVKGFYDLIKAIIKSYYNFFWPSKYQYGNIAGTHAQTINTGSEAKGEGEIQNIEHA